MLRILDRYIFREIAATWLAVTMVLLMILLTNQFARILGEVAKGKLPKGAVIDVIGLSVVQECIQAHDGSVELVDSDEFPGAHFRISIPQAREVAPRKLAANE